MGAAAGRQMELAQRLTEEVTHAMTDLALPGTPEAKATRLLALAEAAGSLGLEAVTALNGFSARFGREALALAMAVVPAPPAAPAAARDDGGGAARAAPAA